MNISVLDPIGDAFERTRDILFVRFDLKKWFVLGFCAFLASLGEGGWGGYGLFEREERGPGQEFNDLEEALSWIREYLVWIVLIGVTVFVTAVALSLLLAWLRSRGKFMFLDGIVHNRGAVVEPWARFRQLGNSLFGFSFFLMILELLTVALIVTIVGMIAWQDIDAGHFGVRSVVALGVGVLLSIFAVLVFLVVNLLLDDLVVPTMYVRNIIVMEAWSIVRHELLAAHTGSIVLFFLMKFALGVALGVIAVVAAVLTCCCLVALPYIGTVILLPLLVFSRCYTLCFIEQFGPSFRFFTAGTNDQPMQETVAL